MRETEAAARVFLAELDAQRWRRVGELIHPDWAKLFWEQTLFVARMIGTQPEAQLAGTIFPDPLAVIGVETLVQAEALSPCELVARWAQALHPANREYGGREVHAGSRAPSSGTQVRLARTLLGCALTGEGSATAYYRTDWRAPGGSDPHRSITQVLALAESAGRWWVTDVDFTGEGTGHLVIPDPQWGRLRSAFGTRR